MNDNMSDVDTSNAASTSSDMDIKIGYLGSILMIVGPLLPTYSILGFSFDYIEDGGDGIIVLFIGLISLALIRFNQFKMLVGTSIIVLLIIVPFISDISTIISEPEIGAYVILVSALMTGYTSYQNW